MRRLALAPVVAVPRRARAVPAALLAVLFGAAGAWAGCATPRPATEMIVEIDADDGVRARASEVRVEVYGRARTTDAFPADARHVLPFAVPVGGTGRWGPVLVLAPDARDALRGYRVVAVAREAGGTEITRTSVISGYVDGVTLRFRLFLESSCEGVVCTPESTCRGGACVPAYVDPRSLVDGGLGVDAGPALDAGGVMDAPAADGGGGCGACDDGRACTLDRCVDDVCVHDVACDDGIECTVDGCDAAGACTHAAMDALCTDGTECEVGTCDVPRGRCVYTGDDGLCEDGNVCTLDVCGGAGCVFPVLVGTSCADALYCDGVETCDASGTCVEPTPANPCPGASTCDEAMDRCTGCAGDGDCPGDEVVNGSCDYTDVCDETASRLVTTTTYACVAGTCQPTVSMRTDPCPARDTDGMSCPGSGCSSYVCEGFTSTCDSTGELRRSCIDRACVAGACTGGPPRSESGGPCSRGTDGVECASPSCTAYACSYADPTCSTSGLSRRTCTPSRCTADTCQPATPYSENNPAGHGSCNRTTNGVSCGPCQTCSGGLCGAPMCGMDAGPPPPDAPAAPDAPDAPDARMSPDSPFMPIDDGGPVVGLDAGGCGSAPCCATPSLCFGTTPFCCPGPGATPNGCTPNPCAG